ncbi:hypothetical protein RSAG8_05773, partial [Rhizoctonia solani AG-8 WAC10335]
MLNRVMRSGRTYDPGQATAPKRRTRKSQQKKPSVASEAQVTHVFETPDTAGNHDEQAESTNREPITFGTIPAEDRAEGSLVLSGTGRRKGVALVDDNGVKVSPSVYKAMKNHAAPIRRLVTPRIAIPTYARQLLPVAPFAVDTPEVNRDDSPSMIVEPETPIKTEYGLGLELGKSGNTIFVTARTSCTHDVESEDESYNETRIRTWDEETRRIDGLDEEAEGLPELDIEWYRDHWSRSNYLSRPATEATSQVDDDVESVRVNALIYEVDEHYVYSDDEYAEVLRNLCGEDRVHEYVNAQSRGQG